MLRLRRATNIALLRKKALSFKQQKKLRKRKVTKLSNEKVANLFLNATKNRNIMYI